jgi:dTDP-4-dehydrorhamnose reductase
MTFFTDEVRCPAHAADVAAAIARVAPRSDIVGILHVAGPEPVSRLDLATALARFAGAGDISLPASTIAESGMVRAGNIVLDTSLATSLGISCAGLADRAVSS